MSPLLEEINVTSKIAYVGLVVAVMLSLALTARSEIKVTVEHKSGAAATADFKFKNMPPPAKDDAAAKAKLALVLGVKDGNSADLSALTDGILPSSEDEPAANFFFNAGTLGGRFRIDLGSTIEIAQVNTYSWHPDTRGPQVYILYASDGTDPKFNVEPGVTTDPLTCGWKVIALVDTRPERGNGGGQYGVSISDSSGVLGRFRYLLFDCDATEYDDPFGNTFYSEVDVVAKK